MVAHVVTCVRARPFQCDTLGMDSHVVARVRSDVIHLGWSSMLAPRTNGAPGVLPQTNWFNSSGDVLQGGNLLDVHGPMFFELLRLLLPTLIPELGAAFCAAKNASPGRMK